MIVKNQLNKGKIQKLNKALAEYRSAVVELDKLNQKERAKIKKHLWMLESEFSVKIESTS